MMDYTRHPGFNDHKAVCIFTDKDTGLLAIVAIHNDSLGKKTIGGTRMVPIIQDPEAHSVYKGFAYRSFEEALTDVLRLSEGMTDKCAWAGLKYGGAKAVIAGDPRTKKHQNFCMHSRGESISWTASFLPEKT